VLLLIPGTVYLAIYLAYLRTREYRKQEIGQLMTTVSKVRSNNSTPNELKHTLLKELDFLYNWKNYAVPLSMSCLATLFATFVALSKANMALGIDTAVFLKVPVPVLAGIAGAYVANLVHLADHARDRNLSSFDFQEAWIRIIGGAALGYVSAVVVADKLQVLAAFGMGVIPIKEGLDWIKEKTVEAWGRKAKTSLPTEPPSLHHLQGVTEEILDALREQHITSTQQLAYASPIKLIARTNIEWVVVLDLIDQALLFNYCGESIAKFRELGIRGSIEMATLHEELHSSNTDRRLPAEKTLDSMVTILSMNENALKHTIRALYDDLTVGQLAYLFGSHLGTTSPIVLKRTA
jgi:hypothetical protein